MSYPPTWRQVTAPSLALQLMQQHPFALLLSQSDTLHATRIPVLADHDADGHLRLRAHLNAQNPQAAHLDGAEVLVVFSGPSTYVSPNWRADRSRGGTYDYEEVQVRGRVQVQTGLDDFRQLIDALSALIEPQYAEVSADPVWSTAQAPPGYLERLFPQVRCFSIAVSAVRTVSKLHQHFPEADRRSIAAHLQRCHRQDAQAIAARILATLPAADPAPASTTEVRACAG